MENSSPGKKRRVKRCLFGRPDQQEVERWLDDSSKKQLSHSREKWSFDFELDAPVGGEVEYELVPANKVPSLYKSCTVGRRKTRLVSEFNPNIPSASIEDEKTDEEPSNHRPLTRSCTKQQDSIESQNHRNLKQAKLTNYLKVRKRRSVESRNVKDAVTPIKNMKSAAPSSPFRFVEPSVDLEMVIGDETSPRSLSASPPKSPRKRPAQRTIHSSQLSKLRSHAVVRN